jgi:microcystin-dependent protein
MSQPFIGQIMMTGFNFAPTGWALCNGQTLSISQNAALFSLIGTYYGGNGVSTFQLPNLQSSVPIHQGTGAGLSTYVIGQVGGTENVSLLYNNMPQHNHLINVSTAYGTLTTPSGNILGVTNGGTPSAPAAGNNDFVSTASNATLAATAVGTAGGNVPHTNLQPYLVINFVIALVGIFPSRN